MQNEKNVIHIVADHFEDLTHLLGRLSEQGGRIDATSPVDEIKRPVISRQRHPRAGDALVTMLKEGKPAVEELALVQQHRKGDAEGPQFSLTRHVPGFSTSAAQSHM